MPKRIGGKTEQVAIRLEVGVLRRFDKLSKQMTRRRSGPFSFALCRADLLRTALRTALMVGLEVLEKEATK